MVDSDLSAEVMLADLLQKEGAVISKSWIYSTEISVFQMQWFYRLGLIFFPDNWHLARSIGLALALALYAGLLLFLSRCAGLGRAGLWLTGALLWPFGQHYLVYTLHGGYYLVYAFFYLPILALILRGQNKDRKMQRRLLVVVCLLALAGGVNGIKELMVFHAPLCLAALAVFVLALHGTGEKDWKKAIRASADACWVLVSSVAAAVASFVGYLFTTVVLTKICEFKSYSAISWNRSDDWFTLDRVIADFFHEFGYQNGAYLFHFSGIATGIGLVLGAVVFVCLVRLLWRLRSLRTTDQLLTLLLFFMILVCGVCYTYFQEYNVYYWMTAIPMGMAVVAVEMKTEHFHLPGARELTAAALALAITVCGVHTVRREMEDPLLAHKGMDVVADWLEQQGYTEGYATFWNANALTGLSDGRIEMWTLVNLNDDVIMDWLQEKEHMTTDPAKPFLLIDTETDGPIEESELVRYGACDQVYDDGRYVIFAFDSAASVHAAAEMARNQA